MVSIALRSTASTIESSSAKAGGDFQRKSLPMLYHIVMVEYLDMGYGNDS